MKQLCVGMILVLLMSFDSQAETRKDPCYMNLSITVWQLKNGISEAVHMVGTPIPQVFRESWICDFKTFDISEERPATKLIEKDPMRFVLTAEHNHRLTIRVTEKEQELFIFTHIRPSTANCLFYGADNRTYFINVCYSVDSHRRGLLSPGIKRE